MAACRQCGAELTAAARFCASCGTPVTTQVGDERKIITVLFADLVGSTATGSEADPEAFGAAIRPQLARIREALEHHGGTIEKYIGDAVVAVFGAPIVREDDPERAVRAAIAIRESLGDAVRVAVNTGEAVVSVGARAERGDEIVLGDVVNTAYRIEEATPNGRIFVGEATYRATSAAIEYGERLLVEAKGKPQPVPVWEVVRARSTVRAPQDRPPLAPLVGREDELALLRNTLARAKRHEAVQLVTVIGGPGIGKSRLVQEFLRGLDESPEPGSWRRGRCLPYGEGLAYWAVGEIVREQAEIGESDDSAVAGEKLRASVREHVSDPGESEWVEANLRPLLGIEGDAAGDRSDESFSAWRRYFEALAERAPLVLLFEDLHWGDDALLDFIEHVADWSRDAPLVLLCTARPELKERRPSWGGYANALTMTLPPLTRDETTELVSLLLSGPHVPDQLRETLLAHADGNPLYAEEFVRMVVERGLVVRGGTGWELRDTELPLPESVHGIIASRLDALAPEEKALVQTAAVVGQTFWPSALAEVAAIETGEITRTLRALERRELFRPQRASAVESEPELTFRHALVREIAYGQIPRARRAEMHLRAARWVDSLGRAEEHSETAAHHFLAALEYARSVGEDVGHVAEPARAALTRAGRRALAVNAYADAARFYGGALELSSPDDEERAELLFCYGKAVSRSSAPEERVLVEARESMLAAGDAERAAESDVMLGELLWRRGRRDDAFAALDEAVAMLDERPASYSKAYALVTLAGFRIRADEAEPALEAARAAMAIADELGLDDLRADALNRIGLARATTGDLGGLDDLEQSIEIAEATNSPEGIRAYFNLGSIVANLGDLARAAELHAQGNRLAERFGDAAWTEYFDAERVYQHYWAGEWDSALVLAEALIERAERGASRRPELDGSLVRGWIALARGDLEQAGMDAGRALGFSRAAGDPQNLYPALAFAARTALAADRRTEATAHVDELLALLEARPSFPSFWVLDVAIVLAELERGEELAVAAERAPGTRWLDAATAYVAEDFERAADVCAEIGALPEEAYIRLASRADGNGAREEAQLERARDFCARVGARPAPPSARERSRAERHLAPRAS